MRRLVGDFGVGSMTKKGREISGGSVVLIIGLVGGPGAPWLSVVRCVVVV